MSTCHCHQIRQMTVICVHLPTTLSKQIPTTMELVMLVITVHPFRILDKKIMMEISGEMLVTTAIYQTDTGTLAVIQSYLFHRWR